MRSCSAYEKRRVLIVDDSALARRNLRQILESAGYDVAEAEDGLSALERYFSTSPTSCCSIS